MGGLKRLPFFVGSPLKTRALQNQSYSSFTNPNFGVYYDPFGMLMPNRHGADGAYRFSFQGQESDPEIKGEGNSVNYSFRMHDPRLGRFFAVDPLTNKYPYWSPYVFSGNQVIHMVELEGLEPATPPIADYIFPDGQEMGREGIEGNLLPLTPPTAGKLTFTFQYPKYAANDLNGYSTWQFDPVKNLWEGESRMVYKETKAGRKSWFASPPDGCVQNGNFLGNCYNVGTSIVGVALFESFIGFPTCPITLSTYNQNDVGQLYDKIVQNARNAVSSTTSGNSTTTTTGVSILLNNAIFTNDDVSNMKQELLKSGLFVGLDLKVELVPNGELTTTDIDGTATQEVGGNIETTTETKTLISDGNR